MRAVTIYRDQRKGKGVSNHVPVELTWETDNSSHAAGTKPGGLLSA